MHDYWEDHSFDYVDLCRKTMSLLYNMLSRFEGWLRDCRRAERSYSTFKVRRGGREEMPVIQGKEQQLRFAGAA